MKKITLLLLLFISTAIYSQKNGITYQAIIFNPNGGKVPGVNNTNAPLANKNICLQFTIVDSGSRAEYQETINTTTDEFGMVNTIIGSGNNSGGYTVSFSNIYWTSDQKSLKVGLDINGKCSNFVEISSQLFTSVPSAFSAQNAENVTGVVSIESGGTNAITVLGAKTNLSLEKVDNTSDINKPISLANQTAFNLKEDSANKSTDIVIDGASNTKYPTVKSVKTYVDANSSIGSSALATEVTRATTVEATLTTNLATETANRVAGDAALNTNLTAEMSRAIAAEATKEVLVNKSTSVVNDAASEIKYPTVKSVKSYVDASSNTASTALTLEISRATAAEGILTTNISNEASARGTADATLTGNLIAEVLRATAAETANTNAITAEAASARTAELMNAALINGEITRATVAEAVLTSALDTKVDKVTGERLINAAEITKLSNQSGINTGDQDLSALATTAATTTALNLKVDKVTGERLINASEITKLSNQSGTNTGDQDLSSYATNTNLDLKANLASPTFTGTVSGITQTMVGLGNVDNTSDADKPVSAATNAVLDTKVDKVTGERLINASEITKLSNQSGTNTGDQDLSSYATNTNLDLKANLTSPTFTGTVFGITQTMVGLGNVDNTSDVDKPVSTATNTVLDTKVDKVTGERLINASEITKLSNQSGTNTGDQDLSSYATNTNLALKAPLASPTFTGTVSGITKTMVGLDNVDNTSDANKPVSTATQTALDLKVDKVPGERLINGTEITKLSNQSGTNTGDQDISGIAVNTTKIGDLSSLTTTAKSSLVAAVNEIESGKAPLASPTFTGTVSGITKTMVGLDNVDNTSDANKPVSTATQTALDLKASLASPTFTGTVTSSGAIIGTSIVKSGGTSSQFLKADGSVDSSTYLTSATTTLDGLTDSKSGGANFSNSLLIGHQTTGVLSNADRNIGIGIGALSSITQGDDNIAVGYQALTSNSTGMQNISIGRQSMLGNVSGSSNTAVGLETLESNSTGHHNAAFGHLTMISNSTGYQNAAYGQEALQGNDTGNKNTALGAESLYNNSQGNFNIAVGFGAMGSNTTGSNNTAVGFNADVSSSALSNATAIGSGAIVTASNKIQLGNASVTSVNTSAAITAASYIKPGGTSSQFLKADGSVDSNTYVSSVSAASTYLPLAGGTLTGGLTGTTLTTSGNVTSAGTVSGANGSFGRLVLSTATVSSSSVNNYDVSGIGILFIEPNSNWENVAGLSGGVTGQVLQIINANNDAISCCTGVVFQHDNAGGTQKIKCSSDMPLGSNEGVTLVFDGTYWRVLKSSGGI